MRALTLMTLRLRRRGFFEGPLRVLFERTRTRYFDACALVIALNGVVVSGFGVIALALYVELRVGEVALFAACLATAFVIEGAVAAMYFLREVSPDRARLVRTPTEGARAPAWSIAAAVPLMLVRRPSLYAIGAVGAAA